MLSKKKGFTLIELMVVIAIIAALAAVITPQVFRQVAKGRVAAAIRSYNSIKTAANAFFVDVGAWPPTCGDVMSMDCESGYFMSEPTSAGWNGPYIDRWPAGPWPGSTYIWIGDYSLYGGGTDFNTVAADERFIIIAGVTNVNDRNALDIAIDGANDGATGACRHDRDVAWWYNCSGDKVCILVSRDGPIS